MNSLNGVEALFSRDGTIEMSDLSPHAQVLEASRQMSGLNDAARAIEAKKPCEGCGGKAAQQDARIASLQSDVRWLRGKVVELTAAVEVLKAGSRGALVRTMPLRITREG